VSHILLRSSRKILTAAALADSITNYLVPWLAVVVPLRKAEEI
jgi:hypothetical protein